MRRTSTPTYRMEALEHNGSSWSIAWSGRANQKRLIAKVQSYEASTQPGGVNEHIGPRKVMVAKLIRQATNEVVCQVRFWV